MEYFPAARGVRLYRNDGQGICVTHRWVHYWEMVTGQRASMTTNPR